MIFPSIALTHKANARQYWFGDDALNGLKSLGDVRLNPGQASLSGLELVKFIGSAPVVVLDRETRLGRSELDSLPNLVAVLRSGVDCSMVDCSAASELGILVVAARPGYVESTAEHGIGLILSAARQTPRYNAGFHQGRETAPAMGIELASATVGLIGYGKVGRYLGRLLGAFGTKVLVADPALSRDDLNLGETLLPLSDLLSRSDFVVLTTAVTAETRGMIDAKALAEMASHAWLVNLARGELINEDALETALKGGVIAGAAMDVGAGADNVPSNRFRGLTNVIATPHIGNLTSASLRRQPIDTVSNLTQILNGAVPASSLNPDRASRLHAWWTAHSPT
jgi:D-3-phosphoglycerate dehydrogenase